MNAAPVAAANRRFLKIVRSSIGARGARSMSTKSGSRTTAGDEAADHQRVAPAAEAALRDAVAPAR